LNAIVNCKFCIAVKCHIQDLFLRFSSLLA